ncbi:hypothetical protein M3P05_09455 [Sansalvadorimonas sp. 2012CJ34-2]|uniref:Uncharacterized protein n=1 Tax=Parendozoicomonas callyspongiae TaxID=2942213 RepID=A0ABT0PFN8_9GAMM|nr:hypothetical protein [Sansalvadorimonas sp. 2012CJ34-2]MCL6270158.1 hypothetical protein [Sansalvadorimonas sp. 2012CJ34-2]
MSPSQPPYRQPRCSLLERCLYYIGYTLIFIAGMTGSTDQACAYEVPIHVDGEKSGSLNFQPPSSPSFTLPNISLPDKLHTGNFKNFVFNTDCIVTIEKAAKALLYSHNCPSQEHYQPPPGKMFFESADEQNQRLILFYEGLFEYSDSAPQKLTIYMSCIRANPQEMTEPTFITTQTPLATIAYTVAAGTFLLDYHPKIRSINILTTPMMLKPVLTPERAELPIIQQRTTLLSTLTGACIGTLTAVAASSFNPHTSLIPLVAIPGCSLCGLLWGRSYQKDEKRNPRHINHTLVLRSRFTTQSPIGQQPGANASEPEPFADDEALPRFHSSTMRKSPPQKKQ